MKTTYKQTNGQTRPYTEIYDIPSLVFKKIPKRFDTHTEPSNHFMGQAYACQTGIFPPKDETVNHRQNFTLSLSTLKPG